VSPAFSPAAGVAHIACRYWVATVAVSVAALTGKRTPLAAEKLAALIVFAPAVDAITITCTEQDAPFKSPEAVTLCPLALTEPDGQVVQAVPSITDKPAGNVLANDQPSQPGIPEVFVTVYVSLTGSKMLGAEPPNATLNCGNRVPKLAVADVDVTVVALS